MDDLIKDIQERTGLPLDPGFTAGKWRWLLDTTADGAARAAAAPNHVRRR